MSAKEDDLALQDRLYLVSCASPVKKILQERNPQNKNISCDEVFPNVYVGNAQFESSCCGSTGNGQCTINSPRTPKELQVFPSDRLKAMPLQGSSQGRCLISSGPFSSSDDPTIPYPRPPPSVELRSGVLISGCQCVKRDGLQHDCPRTGCQGRAPCMAFPAPVCVPSGNAPYQQEPLGASQTPRGYQSPPARVPAERGGRRVPGHSPQPSQEEYVRLAHRNYQENPPLRQRRVPCVEHRHLRG